MLPILNQSLWRDEAFSALLAQFKPLEIINLTIKDVSPPFYYILLHYWTNIFGNSEVVLRALSFIFHVGIVIAVYFIVRKFTNNIYAKILIPFCVFLNPFLLQYAFEARQYSLLAFLTILSSYFLYTKRYLLASFLLTLAMLTHNYGVFTFAAVVLWLIFSEKRKNIYSFFIFPVMALVFWGNVVWHQWENVAGGFWIKQVASGIFVHTLEVFTKGDLSYTTQPLLYLLSLVLLFFAFSRFITKESEEKKDELLFLFVALVPIVITYAISAFFAPIYHERYLIGSLPLLIVFIGISVLRLYESHASVRNSLVVAISLYVFLLFIASESITNTTTKPAINWGVSQILDRAQQGDIIIAEPLTFLETKFYAQNNTKGIKVYTVSEKEIPFYIGKILFKKSEVLQKAPIGKRVWKIYPDGGYALLPTKH